MLLRNNTLRIVNSTRADEGSYVCRADNQFGSAEMTAVLWVKGKWCPGGTLFSARLVKVRHQETDPNACHPRPTAFSAQLLGNLLCSFSCEATALTLKNHITQGHTQQRTCRSHTCTKPHLDFIVRVLKVLFVSVWVWFSLFQVVHSQIEHRLPGVTLQQFCAYRCHACGAQPSQGGGDRRRERGAEL